MHMHEHAANTKSWEIERWRKGFPDVQYTARTTSLKWCQ